MPPARSLAAQLAPTAGLDACHGFCQDRTHWTASRLDPPSELNAILAVGALV